LQGDDVATSWRVIEGFSVGLVIPDLWQQEAVRALQQGKDVVSIRDVDPTKSRTIIASQVSLRYTHARA
jgi:hypothetical protein